MSTFTFTGVRGSAELKIAGEKAGDPLHLAWSESARDGASLAARFTLDDDDHVPAVGDKIELQWETDGMEQVRGKTLLWCTAVSIEHSPGARFADLVARDPLGFCEEEPQFRSYPGRVSLIEVARQVLAFQPGRLDGMEFGRDACGKLPQDYLLQCSESGSQFLSRLADRAGAVLHWDRERLVNAQAGAPDGEQIDLKDAAGLRFVEQRTAEPSLRQLGWLDPVTRSGQIEAVKAKSWSGANGARGLARPAHAMSRPETSGWIGEGLRRAWNGTLEVSSSHAGIRVGSLVEVPGGRSGAVESIQHTFDPLNGGNYENRCRAVPKERWGLGRAATPQALLGPFQAVVMENDDPERLGRVRVALSEDPERRVTPWLPLLTASAGSESGLFWIPEKDSLVLVAAPASCAEAMFVLGGVRGEHHRAPPDCRSAKNAHKALVFRKGVRITVDDDEQTLRFETQGGTWQLDGHGLVKVKARQYDAHFDEAVKLEAGQHVAIDAARIDLG